jgi:thiamine-phosphate pyrophosphorylase
MHFITSYAPDRIERIYKVTESVCKAGAEVVQLSFNGQDLEFYNLALWARDITNHHGVLLCINNRVDIANAVKSDYVHLGQTDMPIHVARSLLLPSIKIGLTITNADQFSDYVDYYGVGPVFSTTTFSRPHREIGIDGVKDIIKKSNKPVVCIGGCNLENYETLLTIGAADVAVIGDIYDTKEVESRVRKYNDIKKRVVVSE